MGHQSSRLRWGAISAPIRSKGSQQKATWICTSQKRTTGNRVGNQSKKRHEDKPDPDDMDSDDDRLETDGDPEDEGYAGAGLLQQRSILAYIGGCTVRWGRMS